MTDAPGNPLKPPSGDDPPISTTMGADAAPASLRSIGTVVAGKYRVERILGRGGMGVVMGARHIALGELVAIKFLSSGAAKDATSTERFLREARAALKIKGEHVVRVLDVGAEDGTPYLVMEHLEGTDLSTSLADRGPLSVSELSLYILQACEALAEAHAQGIVHRDIKPSNLFLAQRPDGSPLIKVLDFGIAKAASSENETSSPSLTDTHAVFGSPAYMSPEQIRSAKRVDARTDIWALGVVMYELLAGQHPFRGESTGAVLASVSADRPESVRNLRADVPRELGALIDKCLEKDPEKRVQSVLELALALAPFAPPGQISTDRIRRLSGRVPPMKPPPTPAASNAPHATNAPWATTRAAPAPKRRWLLPAVLIGGGAGVGVVAAVALAPKPPAAIPTVTTVSPVTATPPAPSASAIETPKATADSPPVEAATPPSALGAGNVSVTASKKTRTTPPGPKNSKTGAPAPVEPVAPPTQQQPPPSPPVAAPPAPATAATVPIEDRRN